MTFLTTRLACAAQYPSDQGSQNLDIKKIKKEGI